MVPVHCCCDPGKHLGWLPEPRGAALVIAIADRPTVAPDGTYDDGYRTATLRLRTLRRGGHTFMAFDSGHQPIEVLRKIPGWRDAGPPWTG